MEQLVRLTDKRGRRHLTVRRLRVSSRSPPHPWPLCRRGDRGEKNFFDLRPSVTGGERGEKRADHVQGEVLRKPSTPGTCRPGESIQAKRASNPKDLEGGHTLKILVTSNQCGFSGVGEGGGEAVRVGKIVLSLETRRQLG